MERTHRKRALRSSESHRNQKIENDSHPRVAAWWRERECLIFTSHSIDFQLIFTYFSCDYFSFILLFSVWCLCASFNSILKKFYFIFFLHSLHSSLGVCYALAALLPSFTTHVSIKKKISSKKFLQSTYTYMRELKLPIYWHVLVN